VAVSAQTVPILPLVVKGSIEIDGEEAGMGTEVTAKIDGVEKGNVIVKDKGFYTLLVNGEEEDQDKKVEFYINGIKARQTEVFTSGGIVDLELSANTKPSILGLDNELIKVIGLVVAIIIVIFAIIFLMKRRKKKK